MTRLPFALLLTALTLSAIAYPLYQWATNAGWIYYLNGYDEYTYLLYSYSLSAQAVTRPGQYVVSLAHQAGLSGGMINLMLDASMLIAFPLLVAAALRHFGWDAQKARWSALLMLGLPLLLGGVNPLIDRLNLWNIHTGTIYWLTVPHLHTPAIVRSPEPQFSLTLLALAGFISLKWRSFWPAYAVLPILYPFVAIPSAFVLLACDMHARWRAAWRFPVAGPLALAFLGVSCAITLYFQILVPGNVREQMVATHLPLISFTGTVCLLIVVAAWRVIPPTTRFPALAVALAPWLAANHQWLSGHIAQPNNAEQYFGTIAVAWLAAMVTLELPRWRLLLLSLAVLLFLRSSYVTFRTNQLSNAQLPLTPALLESLKQAPERTAINDVHMASVMNLVLPRQLPTALSYAQTFGTLAPDHAGPYRCVKKRILAERPNDQGFQASFRFLDSAYQYGGQNIPLLSIFRKHHFQTLQEVDPALCTSQGPQLHYFLIHTP